MVDQPDRPVKRPHIQPREPMSYNPLIDDPDAVPQRRGKRVDDHEKALIANVKKCKKTCQNTRSEVNRYEGDARLEMEKLLKRNEAKFLTARRKLAQYRKEKTARNQGDTEANQSADAAASTDAYINIYDEDAIKALDDESLAALFQ